MNPSLPLVELYPFTAFDSLDLAQKLNGMVARNHDRLIRDFPAVVSKYNGVPTAQQSIENACREMGEGGVYGAYVAVIGGRECGVFSYQQNTLAIRTPFSLTLRKHLVTGPLIAGWFDKARAPHERLALGAVLHIGARILAEEEAVWGRAYTFVRPDNERVRHVLEQEAQHTAFGPFAALGTRFTYPFDGVHAKRLLYVAYHDLTAVREG